MLSKGIKPGEDITGIMSNRLQKKATPMKSARKTPSKTQASSKCTESVFLIECNLLMCCRQAILTK